MAEPERRDQSGLEPNVVLVEARIANYEHIAALFGDLHEFNAQLDTRFALADNWRELLHLHLEQTEHEDDSLWLLAYADQHPVGLLLMEEHHDAPIFRYRYWAEVVALYVRDEARGLGVAQMLMEYGYGWARSRSLHCIQLYVTASNQRARSFYRKEGFEETQAIMRKLIASQDHDVEVPHIHRHGRLHFSEFGERPLDMHWREHQD